jgi:peptide-methionine (S)-S-oxide reductase
MGRPAEILRPTHRHALAVKTMSARLFLWLATLVLSAMPTLTHADSLVLGGGCFWCLDAAYKLKPGVTKVTSGYAGGSVNNPTYHQVSQGDTGHAEVVKIDYDPSLITLDQLLSFFWKIHNPTQVGGQGNDHGPQYRSIILYADEAQKAAAERSRDEEAKKWRKPLTTEIVPLTQFWPAEDYHQDYFAKNPNAGYCVLVIKPKIEKLKHDLPPKP